jgi:hypothetical protein
MSAGSLRGVLIAESLRVGASLSGVTLRVDNVSRIPAPAGDPPGGPPTWTMISFEADGGDAHRLCELLAAALDTGHGWYASFSDDEKMFVVFAGRQFSYILGDLAAKATVEGYARSVGVPDSQLDWEG